MLSACNRVSEEDEMSQSPRHTKETMSKEDKIVMTCFCVGTVMWFTVLVLMRSL